MNKIHNGLALCSSYRKALYPPIWAFIPVGKRKFNYTGNWKDIYNRTFTILTPEKQTDSLSLSHTHSLRTDFNLFFCCLFKNSIFLTSKCGAFLLRIFRLLFQSGKYCGQPSPAVVVSPPTCYSSCNSYSCRKNFSPVFYGRPQLLPVSPRSSSARKIGTRGSAFQQEQTDRNQHQYAQKDDQDRARRRSKQVRVQPGRLCCWFAKSFNTMGQLRQNGIFADISIAKNRLDQYDAGFGANVLDQPQRSRI